MPISTSGLLDAAVKDGVSTALLLTTEKVVTLYVFSKTGKHTNRRVGLQVSPDGIAWANVSGSIKGEGCLSFTGSAVSARAVVTEPEPGSSTVDVHLLAR